MTAGRSGRSIVAAVLCVVIAPALATAATIRADLPGLAGAYDRPGERRTAAFDLGVRLSAIESVTVELLLGDADRGGLCTLSIPEECTSGTRLRIVLAGDDGGSLPVASSGLRRDTLNALGIAMGGILDPVLGFLQDPWPDFLFAGRGTIDVELIASLGPGWIAPGFHRGEVLSAALVVVGTPVPSPSAGASVALGLALLALSAGESLSSAPHRGSSLPG